LAAAAIDGRLYAVGGRIDGNYSRNLASNEAYDPATNRWEQRAPMPTARSGIGAAVVEGRIFVFGGEAPACTFTPEHIAPLGGPRATPSNSGNERHRVWSGPVFMGPLHEFGD
jgi:hypothetical protein